MYGVVDRMFGMYYEIESRRFLNQQDEDIIYGWEGVEQQINIAQENPEQYNTEEYTKGVDADGNMLPF